MPGISLPKDRPAFADGTGPIGLGLAPVRPGRGTLVRVLGLLLAPQRVCQSNFHWLLTQHPYLATRINPVRHHRARRHHFALRRFGSRGTRTLAARTRRKRAAGKMNAVAGLWNEKESDLEPTSLAETKWTVDNLEKRALGEWIEFGRKLRSASDEEILSLIGSVAMYLKDQLKDQTFPSTDYNYREYVRGYANTILKAAQDEHAKRHSERPG